MLIASTPVALSWSVALKLKALSAPTCDAARQPCVVVYDSRTGLIMLRLAQAARVKLPAAAYVPCLSKELDHVEKAHW